MRSYNQLVELLEIRNFTVDGVEQWMWQKGDIHGWEGIINDWNNSHKKAYLEKIKKFNVCIQAGGFCGMYPRLLSNHFKSVYTFEPCNINFHCLVNNCQKNNIYKFHAALGKQSGFIEIDRWGLDNFGMHCVKNNVQGCIPTLTIDSFGFEECDFIQLDVEGYEFEALIGATATIIKYHPVISVERNTLEIEGFLYKFGYIKGRTVNLDTIYY